MSFIKANRYLSDFLLPSNLIREPVRRACQAWSQHRDSSTSKLKTSSDLYFEPPTPPLHNFLILISMKMFSFISTTRVVASAEMEMKLMDWSRRRIFNSFRNPLPYLHNLSNFLLCCCAFLLLLNIYFSTAPFFYTRSLCWLRNCWNCVFNLSSRKFIKTWNEEFFHHARENSLARWRT